MQILSFFNYEFMQRAFIVGTILAIVLPCIGLTVVLKRLSMMGDTLAHSSLSGVAIGLALGFNPVLGSVVACVVAGLSTEFIRNKLKAYEEVSTVIILASSIGVAGVFTSFLNNTNTISSYLFGSIITISDFEFYLAISISLLILISYSLVYKQLYLIVFDNESALFLGINIKLINFIFTVLASLTISISAKTIGSLIVSSLLVIPVITAIEFNLTYRYTLILSIGFSVLFVNLGLIISYFYDLKPGSVIVLISVIILIFTFIIKRGRKK